VCRQHGSQRDVLQVDAKSGGLDVSDVKRLRTLEDENTKLKKLLAEAMLETTQCSRTQKTYGPPRPRKVVARGDGDSCLNVSGLPRVDCCCNPRVKIGGNTKCDLSNGKSRRSWK
jgi:hypothetical protein